MLGNIDPSLVSATPENPVIYRGRNNPVRVTLKQFTTSVTTSAGRYVALDLSDSQRMILLMPGQDETYIFDSATEPGVFDWSQGGGLLSLGLSDYEIPEGVYDCQLTVFDAQHPEGQVVIDAERKSTLLLTARDSTEGGVVPPVLPQPGASGTDNVYQRLAGDVTSALRFVYELEGQVFYLDPSDSEHINLAFGVTLSSGDPGALLNVRREGTIDESFWNWTTGGLVFLGPDGTLTQEPPTTGWELVIGVASSPTRLNIDKDEPVLLA